MRRKLEGLAKRGWVARDDRGWRIRTEGPNLVPARRELLDLERRAMERVARFLGLMHALAVEAQVPAGGAE